MAAKRKRQVALNRVVERAKQPVFLLDDQRTIVAANESLAHFVGLPLEQVIGQNLAYHAAPREEPVAQALQGLCPPPSLLADLPGTYDVLISSNPPESRFFRASIALLIDDKQTQRWLVMVSTNPIAPTPASFELSEAQQLHRKMVQQRRLAGSSVRAQPLLGDSAWMQQAREQFRLAVTHRPRVLISGPQGSGLIELAHAIHYATENAGPLIPLECEILDAENLQSTVIQAKKWMLDQPELQQGWFILKNVETLRRDAQNELMGMLGLPDFDLPTLSTSTLTLDQLSSRPDFNPALARLLGTLAITLPPLTERIEDIPLIAQARIEEHNLDHQRQLEGCASDALDELCSYSWPGGLEEFHNMMDEILARAKGPMIHVEDLPKKLSYARSADRHAANPIESIDLDKYLASIEQELIDRAVRIAGGNKTRAAELLGVSRARVHRKTEPESPVEQGETGAGGDSQRDG